MHPDVVPPLRPPGPANRQARRLNGAYMKGRLRQHTQDAPAGPADRATPPPADSTPPRSLRRQCRELGASWPPEDGATVPKPLRRRHGPVVVRQQDKVPREPRDTVEMYAYRIIVTSVVEGQCSYPSRKLPSCLSRPVLDARRRVGGLPAAVSARVTGKHLPRGILSWARVQPWQEDGLWRPPWPRAPAPSCR